MSPNAPENGLYVPLAAATTAPGSQPRSGWSKHARETHAAILAALPHLTGPDLASLNEACDLITLAARLDRQVKRDGLMIAGSRGQLVQHPLIAEIRQVRSTVAVILDRVSPTQTRAERRQQAGLAREGRTRQ